MTGDIVRQWKEYFRDLLNPTDTPSIEETEAGVSEVDTFITQDKVTEVVREPLSGKAPGVNEIHPESIKALDAVRLSWLTCLCSISWQSGTVPLDWQTRVVVPLFKGELEGVFQLSGDHTPQPPWESLFQGTGEENSANS